MQPVDDRGRAVEKLLAGRYEFLGFLGRGGFASVYQVRSASLQRFEALKVLLEMHVEDSEFARRFRQEARVAASLEHPSIVKIYDSGHVEGTLWYSMQFVEGPTLTGELARRGAFDEETAAQIVVPLLDALDYSHARGIIHRDIKPDNVLLDKRGRPFLMDFGIAKTGDPHQDAGLRQAVRGRLERHGRRARPEPPDGGHPPGIRVIGPAARSARRSRAGTGCARRGGRRDRRPAERRATRKGIPAGALPEGFSRGARPQRRRSTSRCRDR